MIIVVYFAIDVYCRNTRKGKGEGKGRGIYNNYEDCTISLVVFCFLQE